MEAFEYGVVFGPFKNGVRACAVDILVPYGTSREDRESYKKICAIKCCGCSNYRSKVCTGIERNGKALFIAQPEGLTGLDPFRVDAAFQEGICAEYRV